MELGYHFTKLSDQYFVLLFEFWGTMILVAGINFVNDSAFGVGLSLFIALQMAGKISGGHFNPAVSLAVWMGLNELQKNLCLLLMIILVQFIGGFVGGWLVWLIDHTQLTTIYPYNEENIDGAILCEVIFTFWFVYVILILKSRTGALTADGVLGTSVIALTLCAMVLFGGDISGACYNPAVGFACNVWKWFDTGDSRYMEYLWLYLTAPTIGGLIASLWFNTVHKKAISFYGYDRKNQHEKLEEDI